MSEFSLYCDGSVKHGTGYFGYVLFLDKVEVDRGWGMIGQGIKPKVAEKYAIIYGLDSFVRKMDRACPLKVFGDAKQVIESADKDSDIHLRAETIRGWGVPVEFQWTARGNNKLANDLARKMIEYFRIAGKGPKIER
jgi:ribonuclease HI